MKWLLLLVLMPACLPSEKDALVYDIDPEFSDEQRELLYEAADKWNVITNDSNKINFRATSDSKHHILLEDIGPNLDGLYYEGNIYIRRGLLPKRFFVAATHEFGHALGLRHVSNGLMDERASKREFTAEDMQECAIAGSC